MKTETKTFTVYVCGVCGYRSSTKGDIDSCEKKHKCKHSSFKYSFDEACEDHWCFQVKGIVVTCELCNEDLREVSLEDIEDNQEALAKIYKIIEEASK